MSEAKTQESVPVWFTLIFAAYVIGAVPWFFVELIMWTQPGTPYSFSDVVFFTFIWPLRFLMWLLLS
ncbi:MAG: hypothetical protein RLZZ436_2218 [Planctomycetota bacterium]|jgi:hypothetical protein